jgi:hypothetical protein
MMQSSFTFIHIESSNIVPPAFPVELYWGTIPGDEGMSYLLNPQGIERWAQWDNEFLRVHFISNADVQRYGAHPAVICDALCESLSDRTVFSKNPGQALSLITELFSAVDLQPCKMNLLDLENFFLEQLSARGYRDNVGALAEIRQRVAEEHSSYLCGGAFERLYYAEIWKRISSNDRVEPLAGSERGS